MKSILMHNTHSTLDRIEQSILQLKQKQNHSSAIARVVFDCDQTLIQGDIGEYALAYMLYHKLIHDDDRWWHWFTYIPQHITLVHRYRDALTQSDTYLDVQLLKDLWEAYKVLCKENVQYAYIWAAHCFHGYEIKKAQKLCQTIYQQSQIDWTYTHASTQTKSQENHQVTPLPNLLTTRGIRVRDSSRLLIKRLSEQNIEVWIISSSQQLLIQCVAHDLDIPPQQAVTYAKEKF